MSSSSYPNNEFQYSTLDPSTPVEIEEYSDLYDDYLNSPESQRAATMNSGAAVYEQSVAPSYEDLANIIPSSLNNRNAFVSDDSLDSSFGNNDVAFRTPQFSNTSRFGSPCTPIINDLGTPRNIDAHVQYSDSSDNNASLPSLIPIPNNSNHLGTQHRHVAEIGHEYNQSSSSVDDIRDGNISSKEEMRSNYYNKGYQNMNGLSPNQLQGEGEDEDSLEDEEGDEAAEEEKEEEEEEEEEEEYEEEQEEEGAEDDQDEEEALDESYGDYDDAEVERLRLLQRQKNQGLYSSYNPTNGLQNWQSKNDATIITKSPGAPPKAVRKGIKDFLLGKELGEGSYSTVVLATEIKTKKKYAIKILNKRHIIKEKKVKYVNIEKNALNRLGKRNGIIALHFTFQDSQSLYFVLDFAENGELLTLIKKFGTMNEHCTKHYAVQLIDGISFMHKNGVIHRDLKPENILLNKDMKLEITDFGTAKLLDKDDSGNYPRDTRANSFVGTAEYVSPELLNDKYCGKAADIWALGCIIYQMIAGKPPFKATNEYLTFQKIQKLQYAFTAGFPIVIRDLIKRILVLKPRERLTILDIKQHLWFKDINWSDEKQIWNTFPPELGPYKISAKAMKPRPELDLQYPNGSSTSIQNMKKSKSTNYVNAQSNSITQSKPGTVIKPTQRSVSAASAPVLVSNAKSSSQVSQSPVVRSKSKRKKSASSAAAVALYGNSRKASSSTIASTSTTATTGSPLQPSSLAHPQGHTLILQPSSSELQQMTADRIMKSRQHQVKEKPSRSHLKKVNTPPFDVIPGTNIPRPVLNTKVPSSRSNTVTRSRNNSSLKTGKQAKVPQMSVLDMKWVQFLKHHEERIMKVGVVDAIREKTSLFEKKYRGVMIESPLGYKNKDNINQPSIFSSSDIESIRLLDSAALVVDLGENADEEVDETDPENESSATKFRKFFTVKQAPTPQVESKFVTRTMLVTTFGRVLLFQENYGVDNKMKYEMTTEVDLTNSLVHFVEVVVERKNKPSKGLFAIMSNGLTICFEVDKTEITQWTQCLASSRMVEKERRLKEYLNSPAGDTALIYGEETAYAAANLATVKKTISDTTPGNASAGKTTGSSSFPITLRTPSEDTSNHHQHHYQSSHGPKKTAPKPKAVPNREPPKAKKTIGKGPMISAAINKAVSMASVNAAVGVRESDRNGGDRNGGDSKKITQVNSKFLARSRLK
ncbi:hypothetical protein PMKS-000783 [Pichia membranifaciens]|uniref:non-specific serine/threonine protein kinase n=1 Tax=Pichia membranifaciens TaxID=4926 RepID=A0A1Q2YCQ2_9ASCO|nr:hypothetical protein PMKS-000783 [Pichia membranifaciens]